MSVTSKAANPFTHQTAGLRQALVDSVRAEDMAAIGHALRDKAVKGDIAAARLLLSYVLGRPGRPVGPGRLAADEGDETREPVPMMQVSEPALSLAAAREARPIVTRVTSKTLGDMVLHPEKYAASPLARELVEDDPVAPTNVAVANLVGGAAGTVRRGKPAGSPNAPRSGKP